ncbi:uncharacterized protein RHTO_01242 [Rhodotorula toruloides NP11]|uniref:Proteophosphoglycan ppg4 n=1 Tax=Rhodotorula toruloides (strain NP11) TaxID=1130832 RepID=M7WNA3_RHOT1|nr:uncharacterized protein RHTO_01242 [Rhodotorula toruloides NP11]EMS22027.1 hypothetical protein RHTO_01242 [Rhodotorula toruloides NP11]
MLSKTLLAISALSAVALAAPSPGVGVDVVKQANYNEAEKAAKISLKEICYRNLYADVSKYKVKYAKEVLAKDAAGKAVFLFDGIKKDINNREFYYEEFCYKQFNVAEHNADVDKHNTAVVGAAAGLGGKGGVYKRSVVGSSFDPEGFSSGYGSLDGSYGGAGLGYGSGIGYGGIGKGAVGAAFHVRYAKEVALQDAKHANVFLADGIKKDVNSQEFYYEEFCYKAYRAKQTTGTVKGTHIGLVARQLGGLEGGAFDAGSFTDGFEGAGLDGGASLGAAVPEGTSDGVDDF